MSKAKNKQVIVPFCTSCGKPQQFVLIGGYDRVTGEPSKGYRCMTHGCVCNSICNTNGNKWCDVPFFSSRCRRCGVLRD